LHRLLGKFNWADTISCFVQTTDLVSATRVAIRPAQKRIRQFSGCLRDRPAIMDSNSYIAPCGQLQLTPPSAHPQGNWMGYGPIQSLEKEHVSLRHAQRI
jgi:hypothetical protein